MTLSVLLIERHPAVGRGLRALIDTMPEVAVRGVSVDGEVGLAQAVAAPPDVVLVDVELPEAGRALIARLRARLPATRVIALGMYPRRRAMAIAAGAHCFLYKDAGYDALHRAITSDAAVREPVTQATEGGIR